MEVLAAQHDTRRAYVGGGPGVLVSAMVWFSAGLVEQARGTAPGFGVLFFAGMLIFPLSALISRFGFRRAKAATGNPLGGTALESTVAMIGGLLAAWLLLPLKPSWVFPVAAIAVGTHYAVFRTVYGDRLFLLLAALITGLGLAGVFAPAVLGHSLIFGVASAELVLGVILTVRALRTSDISPPLATG